MAMKPNASPFFPAAGPHLSSAVKSPSVSSPPNNPSGAGLPSPQNTGSSRNGPKLLNQGRTMPTPRNSQAHGKRHKNHRKYSAKYLTEDVVGADPILETALLGQRNKRGQVSLNHLLNFSIAPRERYHSYSPTSTHRHRSYGIGSGHHPADKIRFIHANHRFVVHPSGDYRTQSLDPDSYIPWENILQVLISALTHMMACPICLSDVPIAPRMARCGHIACLPCYLRYFASEDLSTGLQGGSMKFRKCPICWDSFQLVELKPVRWYDVDTRTTEEEVLVRNEPREGFDVALRLFMRKSGSTLVMPREDYQALSQSFLLPNGDIPWHYLPEIIRYAGIMKGSGSYMTAEAFREIRELEVVKKIDEGQFGEDGVWTERAIGKIREVAESYSQIPEGPGLQASLAAAERSRKASASADREQVKVFESVSAPAHGHSRGHSPTQHDAGYFFYQPRSASRYYLAPLDIRILRRAFGDYRSFPSAVLARVEHVSSGHIVDDEFRRRTKPLGHLPRGSDVAFIECDWKEIVGPDILDEFSAEIEKRRRLNREKLVREEKERETEEKHWKRVYGNDQEEYEDEYSWGVYSGSSNTEDIQWVIANNSANNSISDESPSLRSEPSMLPHAVTDNNNVAKTVWGTRKISLGVPPIPLSREEKTEPQEDKYFEEGAWLDNWEQALDLEDRSRKSSNKGKKGKKLVLMTNTVKRGMS